MSEWAPRRFYTQAHVVDTDGGFILHLDARPLRTPGKAPLVVPTRGLAEAMAEEWQAQPEKIDPRTMPFTRTANTAIDKVAPQHVEVADMLAEYGDCDLLCYRAESPADPKPPDQRAAGQLPRPDEIPGSQHIADQDLGGMRKSVDAEADQKPYLPENGVGSQWNITQSRDHGQHRELREQQAQGAAEQIEVRTNQVTQGPGIQQSS